MTFVSVDEIFNPILLDLFLKQRIEKVKMPEIVTRHINSIELIKAIKIRFIC